MIEIQAGWKSSINENTALFSMKIKQLLPSLKEKKRYIVFEVIGDSVKVELMKKSVSEALKKFLGEYGFSKLNYRFVNHDTNKGMIKVSNKFVDHVKTALIMISKIDGKEVIVRSVGVSGTINKANVYLR